MGLVLYLISAFWYFVWTACAAYYVRKSINKYPGVLGPEVDAKYKAESALLVLLTPIWPVVLLFLGTRGLWSLVQDVRAYYFKSNRKEGDR